MSKRIRALRPRRLAVEFLEARDMPAATFQIVTLTGNNAAFVPIDAVTGSDQGGVAVSSSQVFVTGQSATGRFNLTDLSGGTSVGSRYDGVTGNVRTGQAYVLGTQDFFFPFAVHPITSSQGGVGVNLTHLIPIDGATGALLTAQATARHRRSSSIRGPASTPATTASSSTPTIPSSMKSIWRPALRGRPRR